MIKTNIIDNIQKKTRGLTDEEAKKISEFVKTNIQESNEKEYDSEEMDFLVRTRTSERVKKRAIEGFLVYLTNEKDEIIGCGMVVKNNGRYQARYLHVRKDYRGQGLGKKICDIREERLRKMGVKEIYIESLKFENTLRFHKSRGFVETGEQTPRKLAIIMKKKL